MLYTGDGLEGPDDIRSRKVSGHILEALNGKLKNLIFTYGISIFTYIVSICLYFARIVAVSCLKETTKAATLWMGTSSARPATPPASECWPPRLALTSEVSGPSRWLVDGAEKNETHTQKKKKSNRKIEERQSSYGMISILHVVVALL